ncbi:hypothetical protein GX48_05405 [Paracoccidioides brasiliensis]|nr:hypothetical protein GX48_05405 [Paracoccidioides brasiliensis]
MLKPFLIRDLLDQPVENEQSSPNSIISPPLNDRPAMSYERTDVPAPHIGPIMVGDSVRPYSNHGISSLPSDEINGGVKSEVDNDGGPSEARSKKSANDSVPSMRNKHRHGIVRVSAEEYDETIAAHPQAKLSYMDEDDGDIITVGSSLELTQRLSEPASPNVRHRGFVSSNAWEVEPMHIFDVNRSKSILDIWRSFERRTSMGSRPLETSTTGVTTTEENTQPKPVFEKGNDDHRERWFQLCNPPQVHTSIRALGEKASSEHGNSVFATQPSELCASGNIEPPQAMSSTSITEEGKQQAQKAGSTLSRARNVTIDAHPSIPAIPLTAENPWASFTTYPSGFGPQDLTQREPESRESPIKNSQPLLASLEAELAKIMENKRVGDSSNTEIQEQKTLENDPPHLQQSSNSEQKPEISSQHIPKPAEMLSQSMHALLGGVRHLTSELRSKLPEIERRLSNAHQQIPSTVQTTIFSTISAIGTHIHSLANAMQDTVASSRVTADRLVEADVLAAEQIVNGLRSLASDIGEMGRNLFATFETMSRGLGSSQAQPNGEPPNHGDIPDQSNPEEPVSQSTASQNVSVNIESLPGIPNSHEASLESESQAATLRENQLANSQINTLFVGNVSSAAAEKDIQDAFAKKGFLGKVNLPKDSATGTHAGFGYIEFPCSFAASAALHALNGDLIFDQAINLEFSHVSMVDSTINSAERLSVGIGRASTIVPAEGNNPQRSLVNGRIPLTGSGDARDPLRDSSDIRRTRSLGVLRRSQVHDPLRHGTRGMAKIKEMSEDLDQSNNEADGLRNRSSWEPERRRPSSLYSSATVANLLTDQDDVEPEFSARYPSLISDAHTRERRSHLLPHQTQGLPRNLSPASQMARFPSISQLEARTSKAQSQQVDQMAGRNPPTPVDVRPFPANRFPEVSTNNRQKTTYPATPPISGIRLPGSWPPEYHSAQPVGLHTSSPAATGELFRSNTTIASNPAARLSGPFVPFGKPHRRRERSGLRRSASESQHRRPLGGFFDRHRSRFEERPAIYSQSILPGIPAESLSSLPGSFPTESPPVIPPKPIHQYSNIQPEMQEQRPRNDGPASYQIERCIRHLALLGYGRNQNHPSHNLKIYAEAAGGVLDDAIEMIEEEQKAFEQRGVSQ